MDELFIIIEDGNGQSEIIAVAQSATDDSEILHWFFDAVTQKLSISRPVQENALGILPKMVHAWSEEEYNMYETLKLSATICSRILQLKLV